MKIKNLKKIGTGIACLFLTACATTKKLDRLAEDKETPQEEISRLQARLDLYEETELGTLVDKYQVLEANLSDELKKSKLANAAFDYLLSEGWEIVNIQGVVKIKPDGENQAEKDCLLISDVGFRDQTIAYEDGFRGSIHSIGTGKALGKVDFKSIRIIGENGKIQEFAEVKIISQEPSN